MRHVICVADERIIAITALFMCETSAIHSRHMISNSIHIQSSTECSLKSSQIKGFRTLVVLAGSAAIHLEIILETFQASQSTGKNAPRTNSRSTVTQLASRIVHVPDTHSKVDMSDQISNLLGSENECLIFDAKNGFDARLMAASMGTVIGGGVIILLTPPLQDWLAPTIDSEPLLSSEQKPSLFLKRFARKLLDHQTLILQADSSATSKQSNSQTQAADHAVLIIDEPDGKQKTPPLEKRSHLVQWQAEQNNLIEQLVLHLGQMNRTTGRNAIVIQGDRGRGKSALVGRALKQYCASDNSLEASISICANRKSACDVLVKHAENSFPFMSIQNALKQRHNILLVEEAGSIPIPILENLLEVSKLVIFITTVQGYEGAGRGFAIRFTKRLNLIAPGWLQLQPMLPVRWSAGDPVESFLNDAFLLGLASDTALVTNELAPALANVRQITKADLVDNNDKLLQEIYGLLTQAHYQTTPNDLRHLLDSENLLVFTQHTQNILTGAALVAIEGNIPQTLHEPIVQKQRRLQDQILPQLLAQSTGSDLGLGSRYARIVRIAIRPDLQQQGFGTQLYNKMRLLLETQVGCIGTSFGSDESTLRFWLKLGLSPIHYGFKVNPRSGLRSACLASATTPTLAKLIDRACRILHTNTSAIHNSVDRTERNIAPDPVIPLIVDACDPERSKDIALTRNKIHNIELHNKEIQYKKLQDKKIDIKEQYYEALIQDYINDHRSFIDTIGLLLNHPYLKNSNQFIELAHDTLITYSELKPSHRREKEDQLRQIASKLLKE